MKFTKGFHKGMKEFGECIGIIVNSILLTATYIIGVGLTSVFAKVFGKHFLETKNKDTYWSDLDLKKKPLEEYYRQF